jgi:hypothetical protein
MPRPTGCAGSSRRAFGLPSLRKQKPKLHRRRSHLRLLLRGCPRDPSSRPPERILVTTTAASGGADGRPAAPTGRRRRPTPRPGPSARDQSTVVSAEIFVEFLARRRRSGLSAPTPRNPLPPALLRLRRQDRDDGDGATGTDSDADARRARSRAEKAKGPAAGMAIGPLRRGAGSVQAFKGIFLVLGSARTKSCDSRSEGLKWYFRRHAKFRFKLNLPRTLRHKVHFMSLRCQQVARCRRIFLLLVGVDGPPS